VIEVRLSVDVLSRARFAYSPLGEVAGSMRLLAAGNVQPPLAPWRRSVQGALAGVDLATIGAAYPPGPFLADFLGADAPTAKTTIEEQVAAIAALPSAQIREELEGVWQGRRMPEATRQLIAEGAGASERLAAAIWDYWRRAIAPHWQRMRSVLDDDVSHRAARLTGSGLHGLLSDLHPEVSIDGDTLYINKPHHADHVYLASELVLIPSIFVWPQLILSHPPGGIILTYGARGVGRLWDETADTQSRNDALGALLGRSRAAILVHVAVPTSTTELADVLGQSPPAVSQHLSVLRRSGLVTARRSGRRMMYQRTPLATSLIALNRPDAAGEALAT
jgi:DNA-binding transcriptional ArsR family regulator